MNLRTLAIACAAAGVAVLPITAAHATPHATPRTASATASNPCDLDPQSGGGVEKLRGPGPESDRGYSVVGATQDGACLKVARPTQDGRVTHTVVIRSGGKVQTHRYASGHSATRMAHDDTTKCRVTVRVRIQHDNGLVGVYGADTVISNCGLFG